MKTPKLTAKMLKDKAAIGDAIDTVLLASKPWLNMSRRVRKAQAGLRRHMNVDGWKMYLLLEQLVNERAAVEMEVVVRWAFEQGVRRRP